MQMRSAPTFALVAAAFVAGYLTRGAREPAPENAPSAAPVPPARSPATSVAKRPRETPPAPPAAEPPRESAPMGDFVDGRCVFKDGRPAAAAHVRAWDTSHLQHGEAGEIGRERVAGEDGRFALDGCRRGDGVAIYAALPGFQTAAATLKIEGERNPATVTFGEGGVLTGSVLDAEGRPAAGAEVRLRPVDRAAHLRDGGSWKLWAEPGIWEWYAATTRTDAAGRYRFEGVPLPRDGVPQPRAPVAEIAGRFWRGEDVAFDTDGQQLVRDIRAGGAAWTDEKIEQPPPRPTAPRRVKGVVVDADGAPVRGARVAYVASDGPRNFTWTEVSSGDDGTFAADLGTDNAHGKTIEVRVAARGFRRWRGTPADGDTIARLEKADHAPVPGRVRGIATDADGKPIAGVIDVMGMDESMEMVTQRTIADAGGSFVLEGVAPGTWQFFLDWDDDRTESAVTEGGEARIELRTSRSAASFVPPAWTDDLAKERAETQTKVQALLVARHEIEVAGEATDPIDKKLFPLHDRLRSLDDARRASLPSRTVAVDGLPKDGVSIVRAECDGHSWRAAATNGVATFPALSPEKWKFVLERPGADDAELETEIVAGDGPQTVAWGKR